MSPVADKDKSVWLGGDEVRKSVIDAFCEDGHAQVIYDSCREFASDEETADGMEVFFSVFDETSKIFGEIR